MTEATSDLLRLGREASADNVDMALVTVASTWSSAPVPAGTQMLVSADGRFAGSVSGGCVEADVIAHAENVIKSGEPALRAYTVAQARAWEVGLACGGEISIYIEPLAADLFQRIDKARTAGKTLQRIVDITTGAYCLRPDSDQAQSLRLTEEETEHADAMIQRDRGGLLPLEQDGRQLLAQTWQAPLRLIIAGAVHTAQVLAGIGSAAGYQVHVVDPRPGFCNADRFPDAMTHADEPSKAMQALRPDARSAVVTLAHDANIDDPVLREALRSDAFYIGALGSRRNHAGRIARLVEQGLSKAECARIHAPVGMNLGGRLPEEIAVAVMAEIVKVRNA